MSGGHPELDWAEDGRDDEEAERRERVRRRVMATVSLFVLLALVTPSIAGLITSTHRNAVVACELYRIQRTPDPESSVAFEIFAPGGAGWQCYTTDARGARTYLGPLGWLPGVPEDLLPAERS